jgi:N-acetylmuramoyl-L-alanine amidase
MKGASVADKDAGGGPVGSGEHVVRDGECISSIARDSGHFWETIWQDPANAELRQRRADPNVLLAGDRVHVPEKRSRVESGGTEARHRFVRKGEPAKLRLRLLEPDDTPDPGQESKAALPRYQGRSVESEDPPIEETKREPQPRRNVPYLLDVDGKLFEGQTDGDGRIEIAIPPNARSGTLTLNPGTDRAERMQLRLGTLSPIGEVVGVKERLANLSFDCGDRTQDETPALHAAIRTFQKQQGLEATGVLDDALRDKLRDAHGS